MSHREMLAMIRPGKYVHTYCGTAIPIGADWPRKKLLKHIEKHGVQLSGPQATAMGHGLCLHDGRTWLFIATKEGAR